MNKRKIEKIREMANGDSPFTPDEKQWLQKRHFNPAKDKVFLLTPEHSTGGHDEKSEHDRQMIKRIRAKIPGIAIIELTEDDLKL